MKKFILILLMTALTFSSFAKTWRKESSTEGVGYVMFNHAVVYNDSETTFEVNFREVRPASKMEFYESEVNISGLRNYGLRIYYDLYPWEKKIIVHVAEDKGIEE